MEENAEEGETNKQKKRNGEVKKCNLYFKPACTRLGKSYLE